MRFLTGIDPVSPVLCLTVLAVCLLHVDLYVFIYTLSWIKTQSWEHNVCQSYRQLHIKRMSLGKNTAALVSNHSNAATDHPVFLSQITEVPNIFPLV